MRASKIGVKDFFRDAAQNRLGSVAAVDERAEQAPGARGRRTVFENYLSQKFCLYLSLCKGPVAGATQDSCPEYGVVLYWPTLKHHDINRVKRLRDFRELEIKRCQRSGGDVNRAVLVDVREFLEMPKGAFCALDYAVWPCEKGLLRFDQRDGLTALNALEKLIQPSAFEASLKFEDGKLRFRCAGGGPTSKLPYDVIECGAEVVDDLSDADTPHGIWGCIGLDLDGQSLRLSVELDSWSIRVRFIEEFDDFSLQGVHLLPCPLEFQSDTSKGIVTSTHTDRLTTMKKPTEPTVQTTKEGLEIPVPKRGDFLSNVKKAATPEKHSQRRATKKR
jgi:hypothetical protein